MNDHPKGAAGIAPAEALAAAGLVDYAAGAVVSRAIAKNEAGTLTLFAFDAGEGLSEHSAPFDAYVLVLDGTAEVVVGGKAVSASAGEMVLMPRNIPHAIRAPERFKMMLVMLRGA